MPEPKVKSTCLTPLGFALGFGLAAYFLVRGGFGFDTAFGFGLLVFTLAMLVGRWLRYMEGEK